MSKARGDSVGNVGITPLGKFGAIVRAVIIGVSIERISTGIGSADVVTCVGFISVEDGVIEVDPGIRARS